MSYFEKLARPREKRRKKEKQATQPKAPKDYNGSKPIKGNFKPEFRKASEMGKNES